MYKQIFTAALALLSITRASVDGEKFSSDGDDSNGQFGLSYYQDSGRPVVVFYSLKDDNVYCLEFREQFEVDRWENADDYDQVSNSKIDYSDVDWTYENGNATMANYSYRIYSPDGSGEAYSGKMDAIEFVFYRRQVTLVGDSKAAEAIKFDINIDGYTWETSDTEPMNNSFVIEFRLEDCSDQYSQERVDSSDSTDDDSNSGGDEGDSAEEMKFKRMAFLKKLGRKAFISRRRMSSDEGISSDDSHEFDVAAAFFTVARTATDENGDDIAVDLEYSNSGDRLYIKIDYFGASMNLDPTAGVQSDAASTGIFVGALISAIAAMLAW